MTITRLRILVLLFWLALGGWYFLYPEDQILPVTADAGTDANGESLHWYKGNTHAHSKLVMGGYRHGDSSPAEVAKWYKDHGYHFVVLTDHNRFEGAASLNRDNTDDSGFLVIPGMEVTSDHRYPGVNQTGKRKIHASGINLNKAVEWDFGNPEKYDIIELQAKRVRENGGLHILNHPNYQFQIELADVLEAKSVGLIEIHNAHPRSNQAGHAGFRPAVEDLWDEILTRGRLIYGVAADDAHDFSWYRKLLRHFGTAPPGGAWVMVRSRAPDVTGITHALETGNFYSSTGVVLKNVTVTDTEYRVEIDMENTEIETEHSWTRSAAPVVPSDDTHYVIEFIGSNGRIIGSSHNHVTASIKLEEDQTYIRARITYLKKTNTPFGADRARAFYAWTQPFMTSSISSDQ